MSSFFRVQVRKNILVETVIKLKRIFKTFFLDRGNDEELLSCYLVVFGSVIPFKINSVPGKHKFIPASKFKKRILVIISILCFAESFRILWVVHQVTSQRMYRHHLQFVGLFLCIATVCFSTWFHIWNGIFNTKALLDTYNVWSHLKTDEVTPFGYTLRGLLPLGLIGPVIVGLLFITMPDLPVFLFTLTGLDPKKTNKLVIFIFYLLEVSRVYVWIGVNLLSDSLDSALYAVISSRINRFLRIRKLPFGFEEFKEMQGLRIYDRLIANGVGDLVLQIKLLAYFQIISGLVLIIHGLSYRGLMNIIVGISIVQPVVFRMKQFLSTMAEANQNSKILQGFWRQRLNAGKTRRQGKIRQMMWRALRPIQPTIGSFYPVKHSTELLFISVCLHNTQAILIALS